MLATSVMPRALGESRTWVHAILLIIALWLVACSSLHPRPAESTSSITAGFQQTGYATWYGKKFQGRKTASGQPFDMHKMTAASRNIPLLSRVKVTNIANGKSVTVTINDHGPFHGDRIIDLSWAAAKKLGFIHKGTAHVRLKVLSVP